MGCEAHLVIGSQIFATEPLLQVWVHGPTSTATAMCRRSCPGAPPAGTKWLPRGLGGPWSQTWFCRGTVHRPHGHRHIHVPPFGPAGRLLRPARDRARLVPAERQTPAPLCGPPRLPQVRVSRSMKGKALVLRLCAKACAAIGQEAGIVGLCIWRWKGR